MNTFTAGENRISSIWTRSRNDWARLDEVDMEPAGLVEKFRLEEHHDIALRQLPDIEHIFSELYTVPESIRKGCHKVKFFCFKRSGASGGCEALQTLFPKAGQSCNSSGITSCGILT